MRYFSNLVKNEFGVSKKVAKHLVRNYGERAFDVLKCCEGKPELLEPLVEGFNHIKGEIVYQSRYEMAIDISDFLCRRTRIAMLDKIAAFKAVEPLVKVLGNERNWSDEHMHKMIFQAREKLKEFD